MATKLQVNNKITASCQTNVSKALYQTLPTSKINFEKTVRPTSFQNPQLRSVLTFFKFVHPWVSFGFAALYRPSFKIWSFSVFVTQFGSSSTASNSMNFAGDTALNCEIENRYVTDSMYHGETTWALASDKLLINYT